MKMQRGSPHVESKALAAAVEREHDNSTKNFLLLLLIAAGAALVNPFVKLKDWLKGENE